MKPRKYFEGVVRRLVSIPVPLDKKLTELLIDPLTNKREYGAFQGLVVKLLTNAVIDAENAIWLKQRDEDPKQ